MCGSVWKFSTVWVGSRAIWQVLNLLALTKEMPASGIHHQCVLYKYTNTHARARTYTLAYIHSYYLLSVVSRCLTSGSSGAHKTELVS